MTLASTTSLAQLTAEVIFHFLLNHNLTRSKQSAFLAADIFCPSCYFHFLSNWKNTDRYVQIKKFPNTPSYLRAARNFRLELLMFSEATKTQRSPNLPNKRSKILSGGEQWKFTAAALIPE